MKVYITKFALSEGVLIDDVEQCDDNKLIVASKSYFTPRRYYRKPDWHKTKESAITRVDNMIEKRMKTLNKSINILSKTNGTEIVNKVKG